MSVESARVRLYWENTKSLGWEKSGRKTEETEVCLTTQSAGRSHARGAEGTVSCTIMVNSPEGLSMTLGE